MRQQFPDYSPDQIDILTVIMLNTQELFLCGQQFIRDHDDVPGIDADGLLLDSDANCPDIDQRAKSAAATSTVVASGPSTRPDLGLNFPPTIDFFDPSDEFSDPFGSGGILPTDPPDRP